MALPPVAVAILLLTGIAAIVAINWETGVGIELESAAVASIALLSFAYGAMAWWASGHWSAECRHLSDAKRLAIAAAAMLIGAAVGYVAFVIAANMGVDTSFH
jgi:hypothetical protein